MSSQDDFSVFLQGKRLVGDDFDADGIRRWFEDEAEGYAGLGASDHTGYEYEYHALNRVHGFSALDGRKIPNALGLGSAYGDEFLPIIDNVERLTIVEASEQLRASDVSGKVVNYVSPDPSGELVFESDTFDLATCFGVLHHIPNVTFVLSELSRVLTPGGVLLLREPIVNMGDWRKPRSGLTARERGIPKHLMEKALADAGLTIERARYIDFPPLVRLSSRFGGDGANPIFNSRALTRLDQVLAALFAWNARYHRPRMWQKFAPASVYWVCRKPVARQ